MNFLCRFVLPIKALRYLNHFNFIVPVCVVTRKSYFVGRSRNWTCIHRVYRSCAQLSRCSFMGCFIFLYVAQHRDEQRVRNTADCRHNGFGHRNKRFEASVNRVSMSWYV